MAHEVEIRWSTPARMDILAVSDRIAGYEIKSDVDSLKRLERQVDAYSDVLERAYVVAGDRHITKASELVPRWWGIWHAHEDNRGNVQLRELRASRLNPAISALAVSTFISRRELTDALTTLGEANLSSRSVDELRVLLVNRFGRKRTVELARHALIRRAPNSRASHNVPAGGGGGGVRS